MLARYIGSKQEVLRPLLEQIEDYAQPGDRIVDAFSGSLSVSLALKRAGYKVSSNDINLFSSVFARAYLTPDVPPGAEVGDLLPRQVELDRTREAKVVADALRSSPGHEFLSNDTWYQDFVGFIALQLFLSSMSVDDLRREDRRSHFFDAYCEDGAKSAFVSTRGSVGRRRFFSAGNARRIDIISNQLRAWNRDGKISDHTLCALLSTFVRAVEKISNTQGTYHDFPRTKWDSRAFKSLKLEPPTLDGLLGTTGGHSCGCEQDSLDYVTTVGPHKVLYLDPPYNFRQYTAYYFMPNVLCRYPSLDDLDGYFANLKYVRGQNPDDDFVSTFCKGRRFIDEMKQLIRGADSETVLISYFTGKNHWSNFDSGPSDTGMELLSELLTDTELFEPESLRVSRVPRLNYASYGGYTARLVDELMLVARRRHDDRREPSDRTSGRLPAVA